MKKTYQEIEIRITAFMQNDVVRTSLYGTFDDVVEWDDNWDGWF